MTDRRQLDRVQKAIASNKDWESAADAGKAYGMARNYFTRKSPPLSPKAAAWLEKMTGYRAAWLLYEELPDRLDASRAADLDAAELKGYQRAVHDVLGAVRGLLGATETVVITPGVELPESEVQKFREQLRGFGLILGVTVPPAKKGQRA